MDLAVENAARRPLVRRFRIFLRERKVLDIAVQVAKKSSSQRISAYFGLENGDAVFVGIRFGEGLGARAGRPHAVTALSVFLLVDRSPSANEDVSGLQGVQVSLDGIHLEKKTGMEPRIIIQAKRENKQTYLPLHFRKNVVSVGGNKEITIKAIHGGRL